MARMLNVPGTFAGIDHLIMRLPDRSNNRHNPLPSACRTHDVLDAAAAVAAERLTALAQSSKAIENARQVPQDRRTSLAGLACRPRDESGGSGGGGAPANALKKRFPSAGSLAAAGGSTAAADGSNDSGGSGSAGGGSNGAGGDPPAADTPFTEADLPNLTVCTRPNGARVVLGGGGGGSAGEVRQRRDDVGVRHVRDEQRTGRELAQPELLHLVPTDLETTHQVTQHAVGPGHG